MKSLIVTSFANGQATIVESLKVRDREITDYHHDTMVENDPNFLAWASVDATRSGDSRGFPMWVGGVDRLP